MKLYEPQDPHRPLDWRLQNARTLVKGGKASPRGIDPVTRRLRRYLEAQLRAPSETERQRGRQRDQDVAKAIVLAVQPNEATHPLRLSLVAGVTCSEVGDASNYGNAVTSLYVATCFDISTRLTDAAFVFAQIRALMRSDPRGWEYLIAYLGGTPVLPVLLHMGGRQAGVTPEALVNLLQQRAGMLRQWKLHLAEEQVDPLHLDAAPEALRLLESQHAVALTREDDSTSHSPLEEIADIMMKSAPIGIRGTASDTTPSWLEPFMGCAAELRVHEQIRMANGEKLFDPEEFRQMKLPPPRHARDDTAESVREGDAKE